MMYYLLILLLYVIPAILTYLFIRDLSKEGLNEPDHKDVVIVFTPMFNLLFGLCYLLYRTLDYFEGKKGKFAKKFFMLK